MVTVVVPVYNVEKYLDRCVESIVNQTYRNLEIILVDDGSPDRCSQMCDDWALRDSRIKVIHKQNAGLGMARNTGIENATGEYICFFDSDDYVPPDTIEKAYNKIAEQRADVVVFGFSDVTPNGELISSRIPTPPKTLYCGEEVRTKFLPDLVGADPKTGVSANLWMSTWSCLFSMKMIRDSGWRFVSEREVISEDIYSLLELYQFVNRVTVLEEALYFVTENTSSLSRAYRADRFEKTRYFYERCIQLCHDCDYISEVEHRCAGVFLSYTIWALKSEVAYHSNFTDRICGITRIIDDDVLQAVLEKKKNDKVGVKQRILFWSMRHKCYLLCYLLLSAQNAVKK